MISFLRGVIASLASVVGLAGALLVMLAGAPFWAVGFLTRLSGKIRGGRVPEALPWPELLQFEPEIGWRNRPRVDGYGDAQGVVYRITTDPEGWRGHVALADADVVVLGDSFAFGHATDDDDFFADLIDRPRIKAVGANGYNMVQELLWLERLADGIRGKLVVWLAYYGNDLYENLVPNLLEYRRPFVRESGDVWEVVTEHVSTDPWPFWEESDFPARLGEICSTTLLSLRAFGAARHLIARAATVCREAGATLIVVGVPEGWQLSESGRRRLQERAPDPESFDSGKPDRALGEACARLGVRFVALGRHLTRSDYLGEGHWTPDGNGKVARLVAEWWTEVRRPADGDVGGSTEPRPQRPEVATPIEGGAR